MAPPKKAKNGHRVMGRLINGAIMLATSSFMLCWKKEINLLLQLQMSCHQYVAYLIQYRIQDVHLDNPFA